MTELFSLILDLFRDNNNVDDEEDISIETISRYINKHKEEILLEYIESALSKAIDLSFTTEIIESDIPNGMVKIEVIAIEVDNSNVKKNWNAIFSSLDPDALYDLRLRIINGDFSYLDGILDNLKKDNKIIAIDEEVNIFRYSFPFQYNTKEEINNSEKEIQKAIKVFIENLESDEGFFEF